MAMTHLSMAGTHASIKNLNLFAGMSREQIRHILTIVRLKPYRAGEVIFRPGDATDRLVLLHHGRVKSFTLTPDGQEKIMHVFTPGDAFCGLLFGTTHGELPWAQALTDVVVSIMDEQMFMRFMVSYPRLCLNLMRYMADHHAADMRRIEGLLHAKISHRLIHTLLELGHRMGCDHEECFELDPSITQEDLANMIGSKRPTVSTLINELRRKGVLSGSGRSVVVHREAALRFVEEGYRGDNRV